VTCKLTFPRVPMVEGRKKWTPNNCITPLNVELSPMLLSPGRRVVATLALFALCCFTCPAWGQNKGKKGSDGSDGSDGSGTSGPKFEIEILSFAGSVRDFNDQADVLGEVDNGDDSRTYYLGTLDTGVRTFDEIRAPEGWKLLSLHSMNKSRQIVGVAKFDPDGDGTDANRDQVLDEGDIDNAGIILTPDANDDGLWELEIVFPGPLSAGCYEINNNGDIIGFDDLLGRVLLRADGTPEPFPIFTFPGQPGHPLSDQNKSGHLYAVRMIGPNYLPQRFDTASGQVISLPTFDRATFNDAYAYSVNSFGVAVGKADGFPAYWSPQGSISRIPGWFKDKNATGEAHSINELGEIVVTSQSKGPHLYSPNLGLVPLRDAIVNPEVIPAGYQLDALFYINNNSTIAGRVKNASFETIPCILHPITIASP
jgi:hypothetical protein